MSALASIFDFLYVYIRSFVCFIFGGYFRVADFDTASQRFIAENLVRIASNGYTDRTLYFESKPILILIVGLFALYSIFGLIRRLMK